MIQSLQEFSWWIPESALSTFSSEKQIFALKVSPDSAPLMLQPALLLHQFLLQKDVGCQVSDGYSLPQNLWSYNKGLRVVSHQLNNTAMEPICWKHRALCS